MIDFLNEVYEEFFGWEKTAGIVEPFKPYSHQQPAVQQFLDNDGQLVLAHATGSGKTATSIFAFEAARRLERASKALVVVPAGLRTNYAEKGVKTFTDDEVQVFGNKAEVRRGTHVGKGNVKDVPYSVIGYELFRSDPVGYMAASGADTLICDEVHRAKDPKGSTYRSLMLARSMAKNFIGMTGSVVSNKPSDIVPLLNLAAGWPIAGKQEAFEKRYIQVVGSRQGFFGGAKKVKRLIRPDEIKARFGEVVNFVSHDDLDDDLFPKKSTEDVLVEMTTEQRELYDFAMKKVPPWVRMRIRKGLPVSQKEANTLFGIISQARQAANSIHTMKDVSLVDAAERTPKIRKVLDDAQQHLDAIPDGQVVMYSNLIKGGIDVMAAGLKARGITFGIFAGKGQEIAGYKVMEESRQQDVRDYLAGKKKVILVSGAGAEGLDLKNTTMVQMLDGHFNPEKIQQAEARGRRAGGLKHRSPENRRVMIKRYKSVMPKAGFFKSIFGGSKDYTTDEWIYGVAKSKNALNDQMRSALKKGKTKPFVAPRGFRPKKYKKRWRVWTATGPEWRYAY